MVERGSREGEREERERRQKEKKWGWGGVHRESGAILLFVPTTLITFIYRTSNSR